MLVLILVDLLVVGAVVGVAGEKPIRFSGGLVIGTLNVVFESAFNPGNRETLEFRSLGEVLLSSSTSIAELKPTFGDMFSAFDILERLDFGWGVVAADADRFSV